MATIKIQRQYRGRCWATRKSDRKFKQIWHRKMRTKVNALCQLARLHDGVTAVSFPKMYEVSDDWLTKYSD